MQNVVELKKITMLKDSYGSQNGIKVEHFLAKKSYEVAASLADQFIVAGVATYSAMSKIVLPEEVDSEVSPGATAETQANAAKTAKERKADNANNSVVAQDQSHR